MSQGIFAGMTDYSDQSLSDVANDIRKWIKYCDSIKIKCESNIAAIKKEGLWESTVPYEFRNFCLNMPIVCDTYIHDFKIVLKSIESDNITQREINLIRNLYNKAHENEKWCMEAYKHSEPRGWCKFGTPEFEKIEELYSAGRDFYVTFFDLSNLVARMEDYMKKDTVVDSSTHIDQSIHLCDQVNLEISGKNNQIGNNFNKDAKQSIWEKFHIPLLVTIIGGVIVAAICFFLKI